ncbi:MAG TPA: hypothetical protein VLQ66_03275 [Paenisporosarcina sp.]|nr:hypothetical protein [Paenisporosarcina sp.]
MVGYVKKGTEVYTEHTDKKEELPKNMAALDLIEDSDFDRMVKLNYDQLMEKKKIIEGQRQYIRYPKLST